MYIHACTMTKTAEKMFGSVPFIVLFTVEKGAFN